MTKAIFCLSLGLNLLDVDIPPVDVREASQAVIFKPTPDSERQVISSALSSSTSSDVYSISMVFPVEVVLFVKGAMFISMTPPFFNTIAVLLLPSLSVSVCQPS